ncbi:MAG: tol-pal system protein YbgF [Deltaproteobacteria bacterium]|nr:tol-pal system protein YbgF [Deltaproteobacteria bacterium]
MKKTKLILIGTLVASVILVSGCIITEADFNRLSNRVAANNRDNYALKTEISDLRAQTKLRDVELDRRIEQTRQNLPDMRLELDRMQTEFQRLTNIIELSQRRNFMDDTQATALKKELNFIKRRLDRLEATLSLSPMRSSSSLPQGEAVKPEQTTVVSSVVKEKPVAEVKPATAEGLYKVAETLYKKSLYDAALNKYKEFLKKYPRSSLAPSAQFFAGECLYQQKKFEEAILEYQKVIKQYGRSPRVSNALLKQAFAFYNIGDKTSSKLLLQKLAREHPKTYSGGVAKKRLSSMK